MQAWKNISKEEAIMLMTGYVTTEGDTLYYEVRGQGEPLLMISGGGGVMRDFGLLNDLAEEMNAQVSASRKTVESGIAPRAIQVGQSGKTVSPRLYMALGINGSIQHIQGLKNVENIISVNTYHNAPIFSISDIAVEGDAKEFILKLIDKIRTEKFLSTRD
jgi:electron transfer flavoprotein alpha subunit